MSNISDHLDVLLPSRFFCEVAAELDALSQGLAIMIKETSRLPTNTPEQARQLGIFFETINRPIDDWINEFVEQSDKEAIYSVLRFHGLNDVVDLYEFIFHLCSTIEMSLDEYELHNTKLGSPDTGQDLDEDEDEVQYVDLNHTVLGRKFIGTYRVI